VDPLVENLLFGMKIDWSVIRLEGDENCQGVDTSNFLINFLFQKL
jgi:hypothetical protein